MLKRGALLLAAVALLIPAAASGSLPSVKGGKFEVTCKPGAIPDQAIDPIVAPGAVSAHMHAFFGNKTLTNTSTPASLQAGGATTCVLTQDTAAYWVPTACNGPCIPVTGGDPKRGPFTNTIKPVKIFAYYFGVPTSQAVEAQFPTDAQLVGGNAAAATPDPTMIGFSCGNGGDHSSPTRSMPYDCTTTNGVHNSDGVVAIVKFPYCLGPNGYEYGDTHGICPAGDTTLGQVQIHVHYGLDTTGYQTGSTLNFSSGPAYTFHGDWINGWPQAKLQSLVTGCLDADKDCGFLTNTNPGP